MAKRKSDLEKFVDGAAPVVVTGFGIWAGFKILEAILTKDEVCLCKGDLCLCGRRQRA